MGICEHCGGEVEFRYMNGSVRPIHLSGSCGARAGSKSFVASSRFLTVESYLDANASCPVCGASVFFYRSPHNGRVFFDYVGWPWPKHSCTDKFRGSDADVRRAKTGSYKFHFRGSDGRQNDVFVVANMVERTESSELEITLKNKRDGSIKILVDLSDLARQSVLKSDIQEPPSVVLARMPGAQTDLSFLCARLQAVIVVKARKVYK